MYRRLCLRAALVLAVCSLLTPAPARAQQQGCRYLIIAPDSYAPALQPLVEWKTKKGMLAKVVSLSVAGSTPTAVRTYVRNAWTSWPVKPEYLLLACGPAQLSGYAYNDDSYYGDMTGNYLMEIPVGRLPAEDVSECSTMVAKILACDRSPSLSDTAWYLMGTTVVSDDSQGGGPDPYYETDSRYARSLWRAAGYTVTDSLSNLRGSTNQQLVAALNQGRSFITYRGVAGGYWWNPFNTFWPDATWHNYCRMPIIISATCETITLAPGEDMLGNVCVRFGTPESLGGVVAFFGTSQSGVQISQYRSAAYRGFFDAVFLEGVSSLGTATLRSRFRVDSLYHNQERYVEWCLLGDPEMTVGTAPPRSIAVEYDSVIPFTQHELPLVVASSGQPVAGALVCVMMDTTVYAVDTTDAQGQACPTFTPARPGVMNVTVTGRNLRPHEGSCRSVFSGGAFVVHLRHDITDPLPGGNEDSCAAAGETITMPTWVQNFGDSAAAGVAASLASSDTMATVLDSVRNLGTIMPGDSSTTGSDGFRFLVAGNCPEGRVLYFDLTCRAGGSTWSSRVAVMTGPPDLELADTTFIEVSGNGNHRLDPCETAQMQVALRNSAYGTAYNVSAILRSYDSRLTVDDSAASYGRIAGLAGATGEGDRFQVTAGTMVPETEIPCSLFITAAGHSWAFGFRIVVGVMGNYDPIPDGPRTPAAYWAYDNVDYGYPERPTYSWVELRGSGTRLDLRDNQTVTIDLPPDFGPFTFYGRQYSQLSICSNGWVAPGVTACSSWANRRLPSPIGTPILAANWDDLYPVRGGGIWYTCDTAGHRFIVEWDSVHYRNPVSKFDKFEVIIYDSTRAARDGNSEFDFQYRYNLFMRRSTVGIQDSAGAIGITALNDSVFHRAAAPIAGGRCIRFSTDVPIPGVTEADRQLTAGALQLQAFPNPSLGRVTIRISSVAPSPGSFLSIFDITGRCVGRLAINDVRCPTSLDLKDLSAGVYVLRLTSVAGSASCKLVLQR